MMDGSGYSKLDRFLHRLAFGGLAIQLDFSETEDVLFKARLAQIEPSPPVFITSLPRAGTTILLEVLAQLDGFASQTYRDMPFVLCPLLWDRVSRGFRRDSVQRPRTQGDRMTISYDSVEAFEEILWRAFYPEHYRGTQIALWSAGDAKEEFKKFFGRHMRKIIALRVKAGRVQGRYLSKNNANIARTELLRDLFPDCTIVIPFRNPIDQAISLHRQHLLFLKLHAESPFVRQYMDWVGHLEFGQLFKPIAFEGIEPSPSLEFWLAYWVAAFQHLLRRKDGLVFLSYEALCERPRDSLRSLGACLSVNIPDGVECEIQPAITYPHAQAQFPPALAEHALHLHESLLTAAVNKPAGRMG